MDDFVRESVPLNLGNPELAGKPDAVWAALRKAGTRLWLDTGDIDAASKIWNAEFEALTTNNTLLNAEVQKGIYDDLIKQAAAIAREENPGIGERELILEIAFALNAHHGRRLVKHFDARVSVELHTDLAHDVDASVAYGRRYHALCPERFFVKIPMTPAGFLSARRLAAEGIPINFTLGFSARQNYLAALLTKPACVNVFLGRLNAFVADNKLGDGTNVGEKAALATQAELIALRKAGRTPSQLIAASMRSGQQVADLAGVDIYTMPVKAAAQYREKPDPEVRSRIDADLDVPLADGVKQEDFGGQTLWDTPPAFKNAVEALLKLDLDAMSPEDLVLHFEQAGLPGFLPRWSAADHDTAQKDGKIPALAHWKDRLAKGDVGLDALMNLSALHSFMSDQAAFDDRIKGLI
jgi:transaldolase